MCGRDYSTYTDEELEMRYLNKNRKWNWPTISQVPLFKPNYNMCPTQKGLVLNVFDGSLGFREMRWGLVPAWAGTIKDADKYSMINAKCEEIAEKRSYKAAYQKRRCIVPLTGFYEWKRSADKKRPFAIHMKDNSIMSVAAVWEHWIGKESGEIVDSFALITTSPNTLMEKIHNRMPVILDPKDEAQWLDPAINDHDKLSTLLKPCPSDWLAAVEVSTLVNSPRNNSPEILKPVQK